MRIGKLAGAALAAAAALLLAACQQSETAIKIGFIDPLSGAFANVGAHGQRELQLVIEDINQRGGVLGGKKFEIVALDRKANPQEALIAMRQLVDQKVRFMFQGNSSAVAGARSEAVAKHNERNPESSVLYLNYGAVDPALTNDKCNFWHFRFDADSVITGNWGSDMALLIKANRDGRVKQVSMWHTNVGGKSDELVGKYRKRYPDANDDFFFLTLQHAMELLVKAMEQTQSADPLKIAKSLEGASYEGITGTVTMRQDNHQLLQPLYVSTIRKTGTAGVKYDVERTGMGFGTDGRIEAKDTVLPTTCKMQRPS